MAKSNKTVLLECKWLNGRYSALKLPSTGKPLAFTNSITAATEEDVEFLKKDHRWGREFAIRGELGAGPASAAKIKVVKGKQDTPVSAPKGSVSERKGPEETEKDTADTSKS